MSISDALIPEFEHEMATTRRVLERVPTGQGNWKPHPKSFSLEHLAQLLSWMPGWITNALQHTELNLSESIGYSSETTAALLGVFDQNVSEALVALRAAKDADYAVLWSLTRAGRVLMTAPRAAVVRMHISHLVHHRGQMTVYLRLLDVPVPPIYGPTADERM